jgi:glycosyltransferase involved in cell wall biosynthesis
MQYKLSLITVCYNAEKTIKDCLNSVLNNHTFKDFEYIIIDGNSTDRTSEIISNYQDKFTASGIPFTLISEPDRGLYDAMNKGVKYSKGEWIWFINSDDYLQKNSLQYVFTKPEIEGYDIIYGKLLKLSNNVIFEVGERELSAESKNVTFNHPSTAVKKECFLSYGFFNEEFKMCADYDFFTRLIHNDAKVLYLNKQLACMREGGISDKLSSYILRGKEHFVIDVKHYGYYIAIKNSTNFFFIGLTKKLLKELLIKLNNEYFLKRYYQTKYSNVGSRGNDSI